MAEGVNNQGMQEGERPPAEDLLDKLIREAEEASPPTEGGAPKELQDQPSVLPPSPLGGLLGGLASNPALLQALPQLLGGLGRLAGGGQSGQSGQNGQQGKALPQGEDVPAPPRGKPSASVDRHTALLCAIKPYLGRERQQAAEYMISLCRVWSTLQGMGISLPQLMSAFTGERTEGK